MCRRGVGSAGSDAQGSLVCHEQSPLRGLLTARRPSHKSTHVTHSSRFPLSAQNDGIGKSVVFTHFIEKHNSLSKKQERNSTTKYLLKTVHGKERPYRRPPPPESQAGGPQNVRTPDRRLCPARGQTRPGSRAPARSPRAPATPSALLSRRPRAGRPAPGEHPRSKGPEEKPADWNHIPKAG